MEIISPQLPAEELKEQRPMAEPSQAVRSRKVDLPMLMNLLGHTKLSTTQVYISAAQETEAQAAINSLYEN